MKHITYILLVILGLFSCTTNTQKTGDNAQDVNSEDGNGNFKELQKLFVIGDFDGDKKVDTLFQHVYSKSSQQEIETAIDPFMVNWDSVVSWFYRQDPNVYVTLNRNKQNPLQLGAGKGLYCLINIGDNNTDGKDEIALVVDLLDYSTINTCSIYTLCNNKWKRLKQFGVYEGAFVYSGDKLPIYQNIRKFLEKQNGKWYYRDLNKEDLETSEYSEMEILTIDTCK